MRINLRLFAILRERAGAAELELDLPEGATIEQAIHTLRDRLPAVSDYVSRSAYAVNRTYAPLTTVLQDGDELALIPPVSGGTK